MNNRTHALTHTLQGLSGKAISSKQLQFCDGILYPWRSPTSNTQTLFLVTRTLASSFNQCRFPGFSPVVRSDPGEPGRIRLSGRAGLMSLYRRNHHTKTWLKTSGCPPRTKQTQEPSEFTTFPFYYLIQFVPVLSQLNHITNFKASLTVAYRK